MAVFSVYAPSGVSISTIRSSWLKRFISQNGDAVQLGGDPTAVRPIGIVTDATTVDDGGTSKIRLTVAGPGERVKLRFGVDIDVSAAGELISCVTATGLGKTAAPGDYVAARIADITAGDIDGTPSQVDREVIVLCSANVLA